MKREIVKSYILSILIILSLVLSWYIWTIKPVYETIEENKVIQDVQIGPKKVLRDIIFPKQLIIHKYQLHYGVTKIEDLDVLLEQFSEWKLKNFEKITNISGNENFLKFVHGTEKLETIYPTPVSIKTMKDNFEEIHLDDLSFNFDRILVSVANKNTQNPKIFFVNYSKQEIYQADVSNINFNVLKRNYYFGVEKFPTYFPYYIKKNNTVFLPEAKTKTYLMTFLTEEIDQELFKDALFIDPKFVKKNTSKSFESFTDGTRLLKVNYKMSNIEYVNPVSIDKTKKEEIESLHQSISFINDHGGFNDNYTLYKNDQQNKFSIFRLNYDNIPVFSKGNFSSIKIKWGNDEAINYSHPLFKLSFPIEREKKTIDLESGYDIISLIKFEKNFDRDLLEDITIAYELSLNDSIGNVAKLEPVWIIKYAGNWKKLSYNNEIGGGNFIGLE
ncbi:MAG: YycH family regulatory protein [Bacillales bacterium]|jgi:regulatory protein YycH of two-component signal transduction system YycFG|nr:YycH family regulatory protein [Bacillales bacterium]